MSGSPGATFVQIPATGGVRQVEDDWLVQPPELLAAANIRFARLGAMDKRFGSTRKANASTIPSTDAPQSLTTGSNGRYALYNYRDSLVYSNGVKLLRHPSRQANYLEHVGKIGGCTPLVRSEASIGSIAALNFDVARTAGCPDATRIADANGKTFLVYAWEAFGKVYIRVLEETSRAQFRDASFAPLTASFSGCNPRLAVCGTTLCLVHHDPTAGGVIWLRTLDTATMQWTSRGQIKAEPEVFDAITYTSTQFLLLWWKKSTSEVYLSKVTTAGVATDLQLESTASSFFVAPSLCVTVGERIWAAYGLEAGDGNAHKLCAITESTFTKVAAPYSVIPGGGGVPIAIVSGVCRFNSGAAMVAYTHQPSGSLGTIRTRVAHVTTAGVVTLGNCIPHSMITGRPYVENAIAYLPCATGGAGQPYNHGAQMSAVLWDMRGIELAAGTTTATPLPVRLASPLSIAPPAWWNSFAFRSGDSSALSWPPCSIIGNGSVYEHVTMEVVRQETSRQRDLRIVSIQDDFSATGYGAMSGATLGRTLAFGGFSYDGATAAELQFVHRPEATVVQDSAVGGSLVAGSTYAWVVVYSWLSDAGEVERSAPSNAITWTLGVGKTSVDVIIPTLAGTGKTGVRAEVYRSVATASSGPYFFVGVADITPSSTATTVTYTDSLSDSSAAVNPQLYTGLIGNIQASMANTVTPTFRWLCAHKNRLFGIDATRRNVWFSSEYVENERPAFHLEFTLPVDDDLVALASLDDTLIAFSSRRIYVLDGDGPSDAFPGADSDYRGFRRLASDVGCADPRSICVTQDGIIFRARSGLRILTRGGSVQIFGDEVRADVLAYSAETWITLHPTSDYLIVWLSDGTNGKQLVFDYRNKKWIQDQRFLSKGQAKAVAPAAISPARYGDTSSGLYFVDPDTGYLWTEDTNTYLDGGVWVSKSITLAHYAGAGPQGFQGVQSFYLLGRKRTDANLVVSESYDYSGIIGSVTTWTDAEIGAFPNLPAVQIRKMLKKKDAMAVSITISDATPTGGGSVGSGRGCDWISFGFDMLPKKQPFLLPAAQQK